MYFDLHIHLRFIHKEFSMLLRIDQYLLSHTERLAHHIGIKPIQVMTVADIAFLIILVWQYFIPSVGVITKVVNVFLIVAICLHLYFSLSPDQAPHPTSDQEASPLFCALRLIAVFLLTLFGVTLLFDSSPLTISMVAGNLCFATSMYFSALVGQATARST